MKKTIALLTMAAAGVALAGAVESTATFGVLKVTSSKKDTVVSVPWVAAGSAENETEAEAALKVKDFVKTSNLVNGDLLLLYHPDEGSFSCWCLTDGAWVGTQTSYNNVSWPAGSANDTLERGQAIILVRNRTITDSAIYLYGQYRDDSEFSYTIDREAGQVSLFAPINTSGSAIGLNSLTWTGRVTGDKIRLQGSGAPLTFTYNGTQWGRYVSGEWKSADVSGGSILPGQGAWYTTVSGSSDVTVSMHTPPAS